MSNHGAERDDEQLAFTVATVWREHRVSCPHQQVLQAFRSGSLPSGAEDFVRFHLEESQCPYCNAVLEDLEAQEVAASKSQLEGLRERLMRSTVAELRRASGTN